jgi:SHS2 domain-containing protein
VLAHTADTGIEATADTLAELVRELAGGMFALISPLDPALARTWVTVGVEADTLPDLVVDILSELLYQSEVGDLVFCDFQVEMGSNLAVIVAAGGIPVSEVDAAGPPIKAVTYHDLVVEKRDNDWYGRVYFDV